MLEGRLPSPVSAWLEMLSAPPRTQKADSPRGLEKLPEQEGAGLRVDKEPLPSNPWSGWGLSPALPASRLPQAALGGASTG